jgi:hypothetical protein
MDFGSFSKLRYSAGLEQCSLPVPEPAEARGNGVSADSCLADYLPRRGKPETDRSAPDKGLLLRCVFHALTCLTCLTRGNRLSPGVSPRPREIAFGTGLINRDVPQHVVQKVLDHDSPAMTAHYARLADATIRRQWEAARKVNAHGETLAHDLGCPLAEAAWARQQIGRATQALPNGYCGLPLVRRCEHANAGPDLPDVHHHRRIPAPAPGTAPADAADHLRGRGARPDPDGGDEPLGRQQPREDHHGPAGGHARSQRGGSRCVLTTPRRLSPHPAAAAS